MARDLLVTVVMPAHNAGRFIGSAVDSILTQTLTRLRLLVVDDASTDGTASVLGRYTDPRLEVVRLKECHGVAAARNTALDLVETPYVAFFDADDVAEPQRLERQLQALEARAAVQIAASQVVVIDEEGRATGATWGHQGDSRDIPAVMLFKNCLATSTILVTRQLIQSERFDTALNPVDDYDMWRRLLDRGRAVCLPERLVRYRVHGASLLHTHTNAAEEGVRRIVAVQLRSLGIEASPEQIDLHRRLGTMHLDPTARGLAEVEAWLERLDEANTASRVYPPDVFRRVLRRYWLAACQAAARGGAWEAWPRIVRSRLTPWLLADAAGRRGLTGLPWGAARGIVRRARSRPATTARTMAR